MTRNRGPSSGGKGKYRTHSRLFCRAEQIYRPSYFSGNPLFKDMKVGLDCANGSSFSIAKSVFDALGARTYVINNEPDGTNINTNCGSTHINVLQQFVKENNLDVGFAYDGDADRCIAVDENGNVVDGDRIMYVCGKYLMEQGRLEDNTIVTTVMSNLGLYKACDKIGMKI